MKHEVKLIIVPVKHGRNKGRFGWVLVGTDTLVKSGQTFNTDANARADAAIYREGADV